ncbi:MAG: CBS domain-containing protein, partial [Candidatus Thermoplasmatota archaeon]
MKRDVASIESDSTIYKACRVYRDLKVGSLLVTRQKKLVGIVTERDIIERSMCNLLDIKKEKIREIMSTDVKTVNPTDRVDKAIKKMKSNKIRRLPVVQSGELVG